MREEASNWLRQAERDKETASHLHESEDYYASVFFSHQASEKAIKAAILEKKKKRIQTHNLVRLAKELRPEDELLTELRDLSPEYIVTRYPDAAEGPTDELYDERKSEYSLKTAEKVIGWIKELLKE